MAEKRIIVKYRRQQRKSEKRPLENINSFLYKLWSMVNDEKLPLIHWSSDGERLVIEDRDKFTETVLDCGEKQPFKTKNIASFIRQLNLYGFRRVKENCGKVPLIFEHEFFIQGRPDLLVEVKRNRPAPMNKPAPPQALVLSPPNIAKPVLQRNQISGIPGFVPYPRLPTTQPYPHFKNPTGANNVPMSLVTPFPVNHAPTFINLGSHSAMLSKPRVSKEVERNGAQNPDSKELYSLKAARESSYNRWQHSAYYTTALQDRKIPTPYNNSMQALLQFQGNRQPYPSQYFNGNMYGIPQLGYRNYGDASENMAYQHHFPSKPYFSFSPFSSPPISQPVSVPASPTSTSSESSAKLATVKAEKDTSPPGIHTTTLDSFDIFASQVQKTSVNEEAVAKLIADDEEKECSPEEKDVKE